MSFALLAIAGTARADGGAPCRGADSEQVMAARAALASAPESLPARFKLADSLIEANCFHDAVHTLEDGKTIHPRSTDLQAKLRNMRSLVNEQDYFEGKEQAELAAKLSRNQLRCTKLGDVAACDEALRLKPDDVEILLGKGDALLKTSRPADAERCIAAHSNAPRMMRASRRNSRRRKLSGSRSLSAARRALTTRRCRPVRAPCRKALRTSSRCIRASRCCIGSVQLAPALTSYIAAHQLRPGDRGVALGLVALTEGNAHSDAVALAARGSALITLRRGSEALAALRQAQTLAPSMPELQARIAQAKQLASAEPPTVPPAILPALGASNDTPAPQVAQAAASIRTLRNRRAVIERRQHQQRTTHVKTISLTLAALILLPLLAQAQERIGADSGKLLLTAGFNDVEGAGGGGLVPWALITGYGTNQSWGANAHYTDVRLREFELRTAGVAVGAFDRIELSAARQELDVTGTAARRGAGFAGRLRPQDPRRR